MYKLLLIILSIIISSVFSKNITAQTVSINTATDFIEVDNQGNIYAVNDYNLKKYNTNGKLLFKYSDRINGNISSIDVTNPLRILVFFKESNVIVFLDWQLLPIADPVNIFENTNSEAEAVAVSSAGNFWMYSEDCGCATLYNDRWKKIQQTENLSDRVTGNKIIFIRENNQKLYIGLPDRVLTFDIFGYYLTTVHFKNASNIKFTGDYISYVKNNNLSIFNLQTKQETTVKLLTEPYRKIFFKDNKIYYLSDEKIIIEKIKN